MKAQGIKKSINWIPLYLKIFVLWKVLFRELKGKPQTEEKEIFVKHVSDKAIIIKIHKEPLKLNNKKRTQFLNGQKIWTDTSPMKM